MLSVSARPSWRRSRCGVCGRRAPRYDRRPARLWRHVPWGRTTVWLRYAPWRVSCGRCGVRVEQVSWAVHGSAFTAPLEELAAYLAQVTDRTTASRLVGICWPALGGIVERVVARRLESTRLAGLRRIGVDEFSYRKRHHYLTVVVDHDRRRVVWAGAGRSAKTLEAFFDRLGPAGCARIELVTADLAASYQKAVRARVPQARVVFDRFHVERLAADAVDDVRRAEQRRLGKRAAKALKGTRYALLKHPARLQPGEARRLARLRRQNRALNRAYELKEYLATILEQATPGEADELLNEWLDWAARSTPGAVRQARADDRQARRGDPRVPGHPDDQRAGRGHQQQATGHRAARLRFPLARPAHLDAVSVLWRHRTGAASTHTTLRRLPITDERPDDCHRRPDPDRPALQRADARGNRCGDGVGRLDARCGRRPAGTIPEGLPRLCRAGRSFQR